MSRSTLIPDDRKVREEKFPAGSSVFVPRPSVAPETLGEAEAAPQDPFQRYRGGLIAGGVILAAGVLVWLLFSGKHDSAPPKREEMHMITLPPPLPPPPPPPPPKPMEPVPPQEQVSAPKPQDTLEAPKDDAMRATDAAGDSFGLTGSLNGTGQGGGGRFGWYASSVQSAIGDGLRRNDKTKNVSLHLEVSIWIDDSGRVTRVELDDDSGNRVVDEAIKNEVLQGLQLQVPPKGMPQPITLQIARR